jgi:pimeloyl-ACP methyl ester carboxylesterase
VLTRFKRTAFIWVTAILGGCLGVPSTEIPVPTIKTVSGGESSRSLVVMLPGRGDRADAFIRAGFQEAGQRHGFDTVAVDAHLGYYMERNLIDRLHADIVAPARAAGYRNIWMLGISMGGLGALLYAAEHPDEVDGVVLLAPYLGDRKAIEDIVAHGPLQTWDGEGSGLEDYEIAIWSWIRDASRGPEPTPIILGYGESDRMAEGYSKIIDVIEPSGVYTREGGHKWTTWRPLWDEIADDIAL